MARSRSKPKKTMYVLPTDHSVSENEQMFTLTVLADDGRGSMLATPGVPFDAASLGYTDEEFLKVVEDNNLPFHTIEAEDLKEFTVEALTKAAKEAGVEGTSAMVKTELVSALSKPVGDDEGKEG